MPPILRAAVLLTAFGIFAAPAPTTLPGVIVEKTVPGQEAAKAGIRPGDVLIGWERGASPPANPTPAKGSFGSPFDVLEVYIEQAPRAKTMTLVVLRDANRLAIPIGQFPWGLEARPRFSPRRLESYEEGKRMAERGHLENARRVRDSLAGELSASGDHVAAAWLRSRTGTSADGDKEADLALASISGAVVEARAAGRLDIEAQLWRRRAEILYEAHRVEDATRAARRSLSIRERISPESLPVAYSLHVLPGDTEDPQFKADNRRALRIAERLAPGSLYEADSLSDLGAVFSHRGDIQAGIDLALRALAIYRQLGPVSSEIGFTLSGLCANEAIRGNLAAAEEYCRQSLELQRKLEPDGRRGVAISLHNLAFTVERRGDLDRARTLYLQALAIRERVEPVSKGMAWNLFELGRVELKRGDLGSAEEFFRRSEAIHDRVAAAHSPHTAEIPARLAEVAYLRRDLEGAEKLLRQASVYYERLSPNGPRAAKVLDDLGRVLGERGRASEAEAHIRRALQLRQKFAPGSRDTAESNHSLGMLLWKIGRLAEAEVALRQAVDDLEVQQNRLGGTEESRSVFSAEFADYYKDYLKLLMELRREQDAFRVLERFRAGSFLRTLAQRDLALKAEIPPELDQERRLANAEYDRTQGRIRDLKPTEDAKRIDEGLARLAELRGKQAEIAERIKKASPRYALLRYPQPLDVAATRAALDPGTVLLSYSVGREKSFLFVVPPASKEDRSLSVLTVPVGDKALREAVDAFRRMIDRKKPSETLAAGGRALYDLLIRPAETLIGQSERLLIVPDGPLHVLPWAALVRGAGADPPEYLVSWKPHGTVVSATVYAQLKKARSDGRRSSAVEVAAFGDPRYPAFAAPKAAARRGDGAEEPEEFTGDDPELGAALRGGYAFEPLPRSRREVETIVRLFAPRSEAYLGEEATEKNAVSIGRNVSIIHYACHAYVNERFPLDSALALTIPERPAPGQDNGLLQAWEIFERVRVDADLVTLSACDTGLGKEMGGEGLIGLTRAFQYAGARSVLASLWKVDDASTVELMKRFYGYLKAGRTKAEALRLAQVDLIASPPYSQPRDWAGFELIGDWK